MAAQRTWAQATGEGDSDETAVRHTDSNGVVLASGDTVTLIEDLNVKGAGFTAKRGTAVRGIPLVADNPQHIEGRVNGQQIVIVTKFVKKSNWLSLDILFDTQLRLLLLCAVSCCSDVGGKYGFCYACVQPLHRDLKGSMKLPVRCWEKNVSLSNCYSMAAGFILAAPLAAYGGSLECHGTIVSPGDTEQRLLETCGNPTSRNGADWTYEIPGSQPVLVTLGNGVVMFIRDVDEAKASTESPLGDHP